MHPIVVKTLKFVVYNVLALAIFWTAAFLLIRLGQAVTPELWVGPKLGQLLGCVVGTGVALAMRARLAAYFLAAMIAYTASEMAHGGYYGITAAQGAPTGFAVMGAAVLGVVFGAILALWGKRLTDRKQPIHEAGPNRDPSTTDTPPSGATALFNGPA